MAAFDDHLVLREIWYQFAALDTKIVPMRAIRVRTALIQTVPLPVSRQVLNGAVLQEAELGVLLKPSKL